jgi:hypothetical protein
MYVMRWTVRRRRVLAAPVAVGAVVTLSTVAECGHLSALLLGVGEFARAVNLVVQSAGTRGARIGGRHSVGEAIDKLDVGCTAIGRATKTGGTKAGENGAHAQTSDLRDSQTSPPGKRIVGEGQSGSKHSRAIR